MPRFRGFTRSKTALASGGLLAALAFLPSNASAQSYAPPECRPVIIVPDCATPARPGIPIPIAPAVPPATPSTPTTPPTTPSTPPTTTPPAATQQTPPQPQQVAQQPQAPADAGFGGLREAAVGGEYFTGGGYIDSAIPVSQFRMRYDSAYNNNRPDRAEFFYPKCGCFKISGLDPNADGPPLPEKKVDYQELRSYLEFAPIPQFSAFVEVPVRWINPDQNQNDVGLGDVMFGAKYAFLYTPDTVLTAQVETF